MRLWSHNVDERNRRGRSIASIGVDCDVIHDLGAVVQEPISHIVKQVDKRLVLKTIDQDFAFGCSHVWSIA